MYVWHAINIKKIFQNYINGKLRRACRLGAHRVTSNTLDCIKLLFMY